MVLASHGHAGVSYNCQNKVAGQFGFNLTIAMTRHYKDTHVFIEEDTAIAAISYPDSRLNRYSLLNGDPPDISQSTATYKFRFAKEDNPYKVLRVEYVVDRKNNSQTAKSEWEDVTPADCIFHDLYDECSFTPSGPRSEFDSCYGFLNDEYTSMVESKHPYFLGQPKITACHE